MWSAIKTLIACKIFGSHEWTSRAEQGVKPQPGDSFVDYATMYCSRCGCVSSISTAAWSHLSPDSALLRRDLIKNEDSEE